MRVSFRVLDALLANARRCFTCRQALKCLRIINGEATLDCPPEIEEHVRLIEESLWLIDLGSKLRGKP